MNKVTVTRMWNIKIFGRWFCYRIQTKQVAV